jgi:hypothetical protein
VTNRARWLAIAAVGIAIVVALLVWRVSRDGRGAGGDERSFDVGSVPVASSELAVSDALVRGTVYPEYTDWSCIFECREPEGCHAEVLMTITYRSGSDELTVKLGGRVDAAMGEGIRLARAQRPPTSVDKIERVELEVAGTFRPGGARPTPRI